LGWLKESEVQDLVVLFWTLMGMARYHCKSLKTSSTSLQGNNKDYQRTEDKPDLEASSCDFERCTQAQKSPQEVFAHPQTWVMRESAIPISVQKNVDEDFHRRPEGIHDIFFGERFFCFTTTRLLNKSNLSQSHHGILKRHIFKRHFHKQN
jgi:hypothetical protein